MRRVGISRRRSSRLFRRTARKLHKRNVRRSARGGRRI